MTVDYSGATETVVVNGTEHNLQTGQLIFAIGTFDPTAENENLPKKP
jgi:hypothetical protein